MASGPRRQACLTNHTLKFKLYLICCAWYRNVFINAKRRIVICVRLSILFGSVFLHYKNIVTWGSVCKVRLGGCYEAYACLFLGRALRSPIWLSTQYSLIHRVILTSVLFSAPWGCSIVYKNEDKSNAYFIAVKKLWLRDESELQR